MASQSQWSYLSSCRVQTFFADERIVAVVRMIGISCRGAAAIAKGTKVELYISSVRKRRNPADLSMLTQELMAKSPRVS